MAVRNRSVTTMILALLAVSRPLLAQPLPNAPALAITQPRATCPPPSKPVACLPIAVTGTRFGTPGSKSSIEVSYIQLPAGKSKSALIRSTDTKILVWNDAQIVVGLTDLGWMPTSVKIKTAAGQSAEIPANDYAYTVYPTSAPAAGQPPPLAIAVDAAGRVFVNEEFHSDLKMWSPQTNAVTGLQYPASPPPGVFAQDLFGDTRSQSSILGEDVIVDPRGIVWFAEGGAYLYDGVNPNHSRIVAYDPVSRGFNVYNVPGDRNEILGLAWDRARWRVWFTESSRVYNCVPWLGCSTALPARLVSFDPNRIPPDGRFAFATAGVACNGGDGTTAGACSNVPGRACVTAGDCELAEQVCPGGPSSDAACYHEYPIPDTKPGHLVVDGAGAVWFTAHGGGNYLGRLDPVTGVVKAFPLPQPLQSSFFGGAPWQIAVAANGDIVFTEFADSAIARFDISKLANPACLSLNASKQNPCITRLVTPGGGPGVQTVHSLAIDAKGNTWFSQGAPVDGLNLTTSLGYVTADWKGITMLPPLSLYPCGSTGTDCGEPPSHPVAFAGAGVAIDRSTGDIWVAEFFRRRLGRLHRVL